MKKRPGFRYIKPIFYAGLFDDPLLLVEMRPLGRSLLFDCGRIHHLAKRVLKSIDAIFISHAHMDHFMGIDTFIRSAHVSPRTINLYGPPGLAMKLLSKLNGYDWNLAEPYWCSFMVHEIHPDETRSFLLPGAEGFPCNPLGATIRSGGAIYENRFVRVDAVSLDHRIPSLAFRIDEKPCFTVDEEKLNAEGLVKGEWLRDLERSFTRGFQGEEPLMVVRRKGGERFEETADTPGDIYRRIRSELKPASIGYLTDWGFMAENIARVEANFQGLSLLVCECSFLAADRDKAHESYHLSTDDLSLIAERLKPGSILPMHLSKGYIHNSRLLYEEISLPPDVALVKIPDLITPRPLIPADVLRIMKG